VYGGDGRTTFDLPDLRGRTAIGVGAGMGLSRINQGQAGGSEAVVLATSQLPVHTHAAQSELQAHLMAANVEAEEASPSANSLARPSSGDIYSDEDPTATMNPNSLAITGTITVGDAGGNQAHNNRAPFLGLRYIVCLEGQYPARS
jgi:microcystin-dependent protein